MSTQKLGRKGSQNGSQNLKLDDAGLLVCREIEQLRSCSLFGGKCIMSSIKACYAEKAIKLRRRNSRHIHNETGPREAGLIRLGVYIEVTPELWAQFKAGRGTWACCGQEWVREDFPTRPYFLITRGVWDKEFYEKVLADPYCVNVQVSCSIFEELGGEVDPSREKLAWFAQFDKVIFRFGTTEQNAETFSHLASEIGIRRWKVMETPMRLRGAPHYYGTRTYLEDAGWNWREFGRCNTECADCVLENGTTLCAARPRILPILAQKEGRTPPPRTIPGRIPINVEEWRVEVISALNELGGQARTRDVYEVLQKRFPMIQKLKPGWTFRVRELIQETSESDKTVYPVVWTLNEQYRSVVVPLPMVN
jgi:hypothetical protein